MNKQVGSFDAPCLFFFSHVRGFYLFDYRLTNALFFALLLQAFLLLFPLFEFPSSFLALEEGDYVGEEGSYQSFHHVFRDSAFGCRIRR